MARMDAKETGRSIFFSEFTGAAAAPESNPARHRTSVQCKYIALYFGLSLQNWWPHAAGQIVSRLREIKFQIRHGGALAAVEF